MTSSEQQLTNENEDPYKSDGHIELKIDKLSGFIQEQIDSYRLSDPIYVRGMPWKILARLRECDQPAVNGQKCLGYYLQFDVGTDTIWDYSTSIKLKVLAQKKGSVDHVREVFATFHTFEGRGLTQYMTFEDLMDPDRGLYDEQTDCIVLAVDFTVNAPKGVGEYVVVAQNELKLNKVPTSFSMQIGHFEWEIKFDAIDQNKKKEGKSLVLCCEDVTNGRVDKVLLELFGYHRDYLKSAAYFPFPTKPAVHRHLFTAKDNSLTIKVPEACDNILFTVRMLKERSQFPDFTKPATMVGRNAANVKLRVGDQLFHINRQLFSTLSDFFDRMFNGLYPDATKEEVELSLITHSAQLFHEFLLVMCVNEALPNSMNVAALFKLADFYNAENVRKKCDQHLRMAREMPLEKRVLMACNHGSEETRDLIVEGASREQSKRINRLLMEKYCPKH